ncbi:MAG: DUF4244 domain-containing protein [Actinomycetota bacterium]
MSDLLLRVWIVLAGARREEDGQTTAEYALVLLAAAALGMLLLTWAKGSGSVKNLFESVIDKILPG